MEKVRAANVMSELTLAKHIDVEVLFQAEARSKCWLIYLEKIFISLVPMLFDLCLRGIHRKKLIENDCFVSAMLLARFCSISSKMTS